MRRNGTTERPVATRKIATHKHAPTLAALVARSTKTIPVPSSKAVLERGVARLPLHAAASRQAPTFWLKCSRMHVRYFGDNMVFFGSTRFIHLAPAAAAFSYFAHPISWPKHNVKTMPPPGIAVDADAAVVCLHDFCHDGKP